MGNISIDEASKRLDISIAELEELILKNEFKTAQQMDPLSWGKLTWFIDEEEINNYKDRK